MNRFCRFQDTDKQLFKLQTQIRAELNILRKTYQQISSPMKKSYQRRHFPMKTQTSQCTNRQENISPTNITINGYSIRRAKKSVSPTFTPQHKSISRQKKHYPLLYKDSISLKYKNSSKPSALVQKKGSFTHTPEKNRKNSIFTNEQSQNLTYRPTKKIHTQQHRYDDKFWL